MNGFSKRMRQIPVLSKPAVIVRTITVVIFSIGFGALLGWIANPAINFLYASISHMMSKSAPVDNSFKPNPLGSAVPFALLGLILGGYLGFKALAFFDYLGHRWERMEMGDKVNFFVGSIAGLIIPIPLLLMFQALDIPWQLRVGAIAAAMIGIGALSVYAMQSMSEIFPWSKGRVKGRKSGIRLLDTNIIIDGRIYDVAKTGFLSGGVYVPQFVLEELQYIADSHDALRRQRGRRGLEVLKHMQAEFEMEVGIYDKFAPDLGDGVDSRLVRLAKAIGADIVTNDYNLRSVAELQEVRVMSINDLAIALRPNVLPQETFELMVVREGSQIGQGVGYLEDGTMVVVENGKNHVNETVEVVVTQVIQTERGKMIFAEVDVDEEGKYEARPRRRPTTPRPGA